jgi:adenosylcobalamin-dependent ribonucleoside-triphosphate reductase
MQEAVVTRLLSDEFISKYPDAPDQMKQIGAFVFYRTYSRWLPGQNRRETYKEMVRRSVEYNVDLAARHFIENEIPFDFEEVIKEAEEMFHAMFNLEQFLSGRTMWVGGASSGVAEKYPLANFNCSFTNIQTWRDLAELFYLLLVGTGVGFKITKQFAAALPAVRSDVKIMHRNYNVKPEHEREEHTAIKVITDDFVEIIVGDSKEGWVSAVDIFFDMMTKSKYASITHIELVYDNIRPAGERLKVFGGTASGHAPLMEMFQGFEKVIKNEIDPHLAPWDKVEKLGKNYVKLRPIAIIDMANMIGYNVVVGGVRRTAEIALFDADDWESIFAKYSMNGFWKEEHFLQHEEIGRQLDKIGVTKPGWWDEVGNRSYNSDVNGNDPYNFGRPVHHRRMSNNSIAFTEKPKRNILQFIFQMMRLEGEPGFINLEEAARRRLKRGGVKKPSKDLLDYTMMMIGLNPCAEILLWSKGVCNLTTINCTAFVQNGVLNEQALFEAQRRSVRAGLRMTLVQLELPNWNSVQQRDRLLGNSVTGWQDMLDLIDMNDCDFDDRGQYERWLLKEMGKIADKEATAYANRLRVTKPLLDTTVKPEGTISQVCGSVSPGLHRSKGRHYTRHIRVSAMDPLAKAVQAMGWEVHPEVGTPGDTREEQMANARTIVVAFPVSTGAITTEADVTVDDQFDTYFNFQKLYTSHNSSNTITIKDPASWDRAEQRVWGGWNDFVGVSFLALDGGTYKLAPYEVISQEEYVKTSSDMTPFSSMILEGFENGTFSEIEDAECATGACPIR